MIDNSRFTNSAINYHIGIEGMAAKFSVGILTDNEGNILSACRGEPISLHTISENTLIIRINNLINNLIRGASLSRCIIVNSRICIGLTGTTFSYDREIFLKEKIFNEIKPKFKEVICTGDAEIAFLSCTEENKGSIVLSHLGSTVLMINHSNNKFSFTRHGGWGPIFGDMGSAFYMGREVLKAISNSYDYKKSLSVLWNEVDNWLLKPEPYFDLWEKGSICWKDAKNEYRKCCSNNLDPRTLLFYFSHHFNNNIGFEFHSEGYELWRNIAGGLVIPLMKAYENDEIAQLIVHNAVNCLVDQHYGAFITSELKTFEPVVLFGGVFNHNKIFVDLFKEYLQNKYNKEISFITRFSERAMRPVCGATLLSLSNSKTQNLFVPSNELYNKIYQSQKNIIFSEILKNE